MLKNNADVKFQKDGNFREKAIETFLFDEHVYQSIVNFCDKNNVKLLQFFLHYGLFKLVSRWGTIL